MSSTFSGSLSRAIAYSAAGLLIATSAAQNISHGFAQGSAHSEAFGYILAGGALGCALIMPLSFDAALRAFRNWQFGQAIVALTLGCLCLAYSSTASVGFLAASRAAATAEPAKAQKAEKLAAERKATARAELAGIAPARPSAELEALLEPLADCSEIRGSRKACSQVPNLKAELARAKRREQLIGIVERADDKLEATTVPTVIDPQATALAAYASALGLRVTPDQLGLWLSLLGCVFFEVAAASSLIVAGSLAGARSIASDDEAEALEDEQSGKKRGRKRARPLDDVLNRLKAAGGTIEGSLAEIGMRLGLGSKTTTHRTISQLEQLGDVRVEKIDTGTRVSMKGAANA